MNALFVTMALISITWSGSFAMLAEMRAGADVLQKPFPGLANA
jgi:hypothetical protein